MQVSTPADDLLSPRYHDKLAKLKVERDTVAQQAIDEGRAEIGRLLRQINKRFPDRKFHLHAGMGSIAVYCKRGIFGEDIFAEDYPWTSTAMAEALDRFEVARFLRDRILAAIRIAETIDDEFDGCVDQVDGEE